MKYNEEDKVILRKKAKEEMERLDSIFRNPDYENELNRFKNKFTICEVVYKTVLEKHQLSKGNKIKYADLKLDMRQIPYALEFAGYSYDMILLAQIFGSKKIEHKQSIKKLRDELTHNPSEKALLELLSRSEELHKKMDAFLEVIRRDS